MAKRFRTITWMFGRPVEDGHPDLRRALKAAVKGAKMAGRADVVHDGATLAICKLKNPVSDAEFEWQRRPRGPYGKARKPVADCKLSPEAKRLLRRRT